MKRKQTAKRAENKIFQTFWHCEVEFLKKRVFDQTDDTCLIAVCLNEKWQRQNLLITVKL